MDETLQMADLLASSWKVIITFLLCALFGTVAIIKAYEVLFAKFGWESKNEKRFKAIENRQNILEQNIKDVDQKIEDTKAYFNEQEHEHWEESKVYKERIFDGLNAINAKLDRQDQLDLKKLRHSIVRAGEDAINNGKITVRSLRSLLEMYEEYSVVYKGNSYVTTLMRKVEALPVIGKLDEHGEDIE